MVNEDYSYDFSKQSRNQVFIYNWNHISDVCLTFGKEKITANVHQHGPFSYSCTV